MSTDTHRPQALAARHERFARRVAARLDDGTATLPYEIAERLRASRVQALARRRVPAQVVVNRTYWSGGAVALGGGEEPLGWWERFASVLPLVVLLVGLVWISALQDDQRARELAAVDAALLTDDLPPAAYADPGFARFVQLGQQQASPH